MARYLGGVCKLCRREGEKLFLKGDRCFTSKCGIEKRNFPPGQHTRRVRPSDFGLQLREKQKAKRIYGVLEKQFKGYYSKAARAKGVTGTKMLEMLECRLDNIVYRLGWGSSRNLSRQMISHGHIKVNDEVVSTASFQARPGDKITLVSQEGKDMATLFAAKQKHKVPAWLSEAKVGNKLSSEVLRMPARDEIEASVHEQLIVEYYSR